MARRKVPAIHARGRYPHKAACGVATESEGMEHLDFLQIAADAPDSVCDRCRSIVTGQRRVEPRRFK